MTEFALKNWFGIGVLLLQALIFIVFKFNDLAHLAKNMERLERVVWKRIDEHSNDIKALNRGVARIEGHLGIKDPDSEG